METNPSLLAALCNPPRGRAPPMALGQASVPRLSVSCRPGVHGCPTQPETESCRGGGDRTRSPTTVIVLDTGVDTRRGRAGAGSHPRGPRPPPSETSETGSPTRAPCPRSETRDNTRNLNRRRCVPATPAAYPPHPASGRPHITNLHVILCHLSLCLQKGLETWKNLVYPEEEASSQEDLQTKMKPLCPEQGVSSQLDHYLPNSTQKQDLGLTEKHGTWMIINLYLLKTLEKVF